jgi:hypothetical protein
MSFMATIRIGNKEIKYRARTGLRSKCPCLRMHRNLELEVIIPLGQKIDVENFIREESGWVERKYEELSRTKKVIDGGQVLVRGKYYSLRIDSSDIKNYGNVDLTGDELVVQAEEGADPFTFIVLWMKDKTMEYVTPKVQAYSRKFGVSFNKIYVRSTGKWGLCSRKGDLTFNWQLIALPEDIADYVILHEIAHLLVFDHSRRFKKKLAIMCPDFKEKERQLGIYSTVGSREARGN